MATDFRELDQIVVRFLPLSLQTGGIIHAMPYAKEGYFTRDDACDIELVKFSTRMQFGDSHR